MKYVLILVAFFCLTACSVEMSKVDKDHAKDMSSKLTYFRDSRTGLCFATVASRKTMQTDQSGLGLTCVPCESLKGGVEVY